MLATGPSPMSTNYFRPNLRDLVTVDSQKVPSADVVECMARATSRALAEASVDEWAEGYSWYPRAYAHAAQVASAAGLGDSPESITLGADIIAILSPGCSWEHNASVALDVALGLDPRDITYQGYGNMLLRATWYRHNVTSGELTIPEARAKYLRGQKVTPFAYSVESPWDPSIPPVIDRHMLKLYGLFRPKSLENVGVYDAMALGVALAAEWHGILPNVAQAIAWCYVRDLEYADLHSGGSLPMPY